MSVQGQSSPDSDHLDDIDVNQYATDFERMEDIDKIFDMAEEADLLEVSEDLGKITRKKESSVPDSKVCSKIRRTATKQQETNETSEPNFRLQAVVIESMCESIGDYTQENSECVKAPNSDDNQNNISEAESAEKCKKDLQEKNRDSGIENNNQPDLQHDSNVKLLPTNEPGKSMLDDCGQSINSSLIKTLSLHQKELVKEFWNLPNTRNLLDMGLIYYLVSLQNNQKESTDVVKLIEICKKTGARELLSAILNRRRSNLLESNNEGESRVLNTDKEIETEKATSLPLQCVQCCDNTKIKVTMDEVLNPRSQMESGQSKHTQSMNLEDNGCAERALARTSTTFSLRRSATIPEKIAYLRDNLAEGEATLRSARTDMHRCSERSQKLEAGGNILFPALFTKSEIIDGNVSGKRSDKNPNGNKYSKSKVDLLSELLDWRLEREMEDTLDEFQKYLEETKSVGLGASDFNKLKCTILVNYANHIRPKKHTAKRPRKQNTETCSNKRIKKS